jgi:hypothetical protein
VGQLQEMVVWEDQEEVHFLEGAHKLLEQLPDQQMLLAVIMVEVEEVLFFHQQVVLALAVL